MTQIPSDDILEGLYKLRIRESEKLKTVLELYDLETHQKKAGPDCHRLKAMVKRCIEQNLRMKNFEARNGNYETSTVVKNPGTKQRGPRILGDRWQWKTNGQCSKGDNCSFRHDINRRAKSTQPNHSPGSSSQQSVKSAWRTRSLRGRSPSGKMARLPCKDYLKGTCTTPFWENGILQNACSTRPRVVVGLGTSALMHTVRLKNNLAKRSKKWWQSAVVMLKITRQLGCVFKDLEPPKSSSILRKSSNIRKPIRCVQFTKAVVRHAAIRDKNPSLGMICPADPHQRNPNAPKWGSVSGRDGMVRAMCLWSSVEAGQKHPKIRGER